MRKLLVMLGDNFVEKISHRENFGKSGKLPDGKISPRNFPPDFRAFSGNRFVNQDEKVASGEFRENFSPIFSEIPGKPVGKVSLFGKFPDEFPSEIPGVKIPYIRDLPTVIHYKVIKTYKNWEENCREKLATGKLREKISGNFPKFPKFTFSGFSKKGVLWAVIIDFRCFLGVRKCKENTKKTREKTPSLFSRISEFPIFFFSISIFSLFRMFRFVIAYALYKFYKFSITTQKKSDNIFVENAKKNFFVQKFFRADIFVTKSPKKVIKFIFLKDAVLACTIRFDPPKSGG